jgi:hypothetical protein
MAARVLLTQQVVILWVTGDRFGVDIEQYSIDIHEMPFTIAQCLK